MISFFSLTRIKRKHFLNDYLLITWYSDSELPLLLKYRNKFKTDSPEQLPVRDLCSPELAGGGNITYAAEYKARQKQLGWQHHSHKRVMSCSAGRCHSVKTCFVQKYKVTHEEINNASNSFKKKSKKIQLGNYFKTQAMIRAHTFQTLFSSRFHQLWLLGCKS